MIIIEEAITANRFDIVRNNHIHIAAGVLYKKPVNGIEFLGDIIPPLGIIESKRFDLLDTFGEIDFFERTVFEGSDAYLFESVGKNNSF